MLENKGFEHRDELIAFLKKHRAELAEEKEDRAANAGAKVLLEKIGGSIEANAEKKTKKEKAQSGKGGGEKRSKKARKEG